MCTYTHMQYQMLMGAEPLELSFVSTVSEQWYMHHSKTVRQFLIALNVLCHMI